MTRPALDAAAPRPAGGGLTAYLALLWSTGRGALWRALLLGAAATGVELVSLVMLAPVLRALGVDGPPTRLDASSRAILRLLPFTATPIVLLGAFGLLLALRALVRRQDEIATVALAERFLLALRVRAYRAILGADWRFLSSLRGADLIAALTSQTERIAILPYLLLAILSQALVAAAYLLAALLVSPAMTAIALACGVVLLALLHGRTRRARRAGERLADLTDELFAASGDHIAALKLTKSQRAEERSIAVFTDVSERTTTLNIEAGELRASAHALLELGSATVLVIALAAATTGLHLGAAAILLLLVLFSRLPPRLASIQDASQRIALALPAFDEVRALIARCEARREGPTPPATGVPRLTIVETPPAIRLEHVTVRLAPDRPPVLRDLTLPIPGGRTTAVVGLSGAGKTTLADVVTGLLLPDEGSALVRGLPLDGERALAWREQIGYVAQEPFLFHDTIRANLRWARPDATDAELHDVLRAAAAGDFIDRLPLGLDTIVGDRGARLSGGERQRLALARALLRARSLLILDEATSAVDAETEAQILRAVDALRGRLTVLVIAHRLSAIRDADLVHVVEDGTLVESGTCLELLGRGGRLASLWHAQYAAPVSTAATPRDTADVGGATGRRPVPSIVS